MKDARILALVLLPLIACAGPRGASKGQKQAIGITKAIDDVGDALGRGRAAIQITVQAHDELVSGKDGKLLVHYAELRDGQKEMAAAREKVDDKLSDLLAEGEVYFADWAEGLDDIHNETLREQSRRRHGDARASFDAMAAASRRIAELWDPVQQIVGDEVSYLSHDLNASSVQSLSTEAQTLRSAVADLGTAMNDYQRRAEEFRALVSPEGAGG